MSVQRNRYDLDTAELETPIETGRPKKLSHVLTIVAAVEFLVVTALAYLIAAVYLRVLSDGPPTALYVFSGLLLPVLILLVSILFRHYPKLQREATHHVLWNTLVAIVLAFSFFLSLLFLFKVSEVYSRVIFFFQLFAITAAIITVRAVSRSFVQAAIADGRVKARRAILIGDALHYSEIKKPLIDAGVDSVRILPFPEFVSCPDTNRTDLDNQ
jgi:FlaA1/EpsC-like NDP-sugar epimerase